MLNIFRNSISKTIIQSGCPLPRTINPINIKVVGVGGAGTNAISQLNDVHGKELDIIAINTDTQALQQISHLRTFAIGPLLTRGMGAGGRPEIGRKAMKESYQQISDLLSGADVVFIAAGLGGGTGTGAAPIVAEIAKKQGSVAIGIISTPFKFEGLARFSVAQQGLTQIRHKVHSFVTLENDRLLSKSLEGSTLSTAFSRSDQTLSQGITGLVNILRYPGTINVDFADFRRVMSVPGSAFMSMSSAEGSGAVFEAVQNSIESPLFVQPLKGCSNILLNVQAGEDMLLSELHEAANHLRQSTGTSTEIILGVHQSKQFRNRADVTIFATGSDLSGICKDHAKSKTNKAYADNSNIMTKYVNANVYDMEYLPERLL